MFFLQIEVCEKKLHEQEEKVDQQEREVQHSRRSFTARLAQQVARASKVGYCYCCCCCFC